MTNKNKPKTKTIIMPVGKFAGKKKSLPVKEAEKIISVHGEYAPTGIEEIDSSDSKANIDELEKQLAAEKEKVDKLEKLLEEASNSDGDGDDDGAKNE